MTTILKAHSNPLHADNNMDTIARALRKVYSDSILAGPPTNAGAAVLDYSEAGAQNESSIQAWVTSDIYGANVSTDHQNVCSPWMKVCFIIPCIFALHEGWWDETRHASSPGWDLQMPGHRGNSGTVALQR